MRAGSLSVLAAVSLVLVSGSACAMNAPSTSDPSCRVTGADKLPEEIGGSGAICQAIEKALAESAVQGPVTVDVTVRSRYALAATIRRGDRVLPELTMDISDRAITKGSVESFARGIAEAAAAGA